MIQPNTGDVVSFKLVQAGIIVGSDGYTNVAVNAGNVTYDVARIIDPEIASKAANLYPYFKDKVNNVSDPSIYPYFIIIDTNGVLTALGIPWIDETSYQILDTKVCTIVINNYQVAWESAIKDNLNNLGASYTFSIQEVTNGGTTPVI